MGKNCQNQRYEIWNLIKALHPSQRVQIQGTWLIFGNNSETVGHPNSPPSQSSLSSLGIKCQNNSSHFQY